MTTNHHPTGTTRRLAGNILIYLGGLALVGSSAAKFARVPAVVDHLAVNGFAGGLVTLVAVLEMLSAALFLTRPTRAGGLLMVSAFLGGAIATHLQHGQSPAGPAVLLALLWIGVWLRHPETLWSYRRGTDRAPGGHEKQAAGPRFSRIVM